MIFTKLSPNFPARLFSLLTPGIAKSGADGLRLREGDARKPESNPDTFGELRNIWH